MHSIIQRFPNIARQPALGLLVVVILVTSCAHYRTGSLMHPDIHSIAIGPVANRTDIAELGPYVDAALPARFLNDGSLDVNSSGEKADIVLNATVVSYQISSIGEARTDSRDKKQRVYRPTIYGVQVTIEFSVKRRGAARPMMPVRTVTGDAEFSEFADLDVVRKDGLRLAADNAVQKLVHAVTEAW